MKIVYIITMLAVLTAAAPQPRHRAFAQQFLRDIFTLRLAAQTQLNNHLSVNTLMLHQVAGYQNSLSELNISGTRDKFAELQAHLRKFNTQRKDSGEEIAMQRLLEGLNLSPVEIDQMKEKIVGDIPFESFVENHNGVVLSGERFSDWLYKNAEKQIRDVLLTLAKLQGVIDASNDFALALAGRGMLSTERLAAKFAELVEEYSYIYISNLDMRRTLEKAQKIAAEAPQSESEQTAQLNELQALLQPAIDSVLAKTDETWVVEHRRAIEQIMHIDKDMIEIFFSRHMLVYNRFLREDLFRQALDAYETTSSILDDYLNVVKQQPQQEDSARRVAIAKLAADQDSFDRLVAVYRLQHSYDEIATEQIQGDTAEAAKKYAELFTAKAHLFAALARPSAQHGGSLDQNKNNIDLVRAALESAPFKADLALERGADADYVLMLVASTEIAKQERMVKFLIERGGASLGGALLLAVSSPEQLAVEPLVNMFGADPTIALAKAMLQNHSMGVRQALLELGADAKRAKTLIAPDTNGMKMLLAASEANKEDEAKFLIAQGVSPTSTLIHIAKTGGSVA